MFFIYNTKINCFQVGELLQLRGMDTNQHSRDVRRRIRSSSSRAEIALVFRVPRAHYLSLEHLRGLSGLHKYLRGI